MKIVTLADVRKEKALKDARADYLESKAAAKQAAAKQAAIAKREQELLQQYPQIGIVIRDGRKQYYYINNMQQVVTRCKLENLVDKIKMGSSITA